MAIEFSNRFKELSKLGQNPMKIVEALASADSSNANIAKQVIAIAGGMCPHCGAPIEADLDFARVVEITLNDYSSSHIAIMSWIEGSSSSTWYKYSDGISSHKNTVFPALQIV